LGSCQIAGVYQQTCSNFRAEGFDQQHMAIGRIAVWPMQGQGPDFLNKSALERRFEQALMESIGASAVITRDELAQHLADLSDSKVVLTEINDYARTGILPVTSARRIGQQLEARYLIFSQLREPTSDETDRRVSRQDGNPRPAIREVFIESEIWDLKESTVVWEGEAGLLFLPSRRISVSDKIGKELASIVGAAAGVGPCESRADYRQDIANTKSKTSALVIVITLVIMLPLYLLI
jgi:hypothetical protein